MNRYLESPPEDLLAKFNVLADRMIDDGMEKEGQTIKKALQDQQEGKTSAERSSRVMKDKKKPPVPFLPSNLMVLITFLPDKCINQSTTSVD